METGSHWRKFLVGDFDVFLSFSSLLRSREVSDKCGSSEHSKPLPHAEKLGVVGCEVQRDTVITLVSPI